MSPLSRGGIYRGGNLVHIIFVNLDIHSVHLLRYYLGVIIRRASYTFLIVLAVVMGGAIAPPDIANALFEPTKSSEITVSVDGTTLGVTSTAYISGDSDPYLGVFGGGDTPASGSEPGVGELTTMYTSKNDSTGEPQLAYFQAQGGIVKATCGAGGNPSSGVAFYQKSRVTLAGLTVGDKVWAFYDPAVGSGVNIKGAPYWDYRSDVDPAIANVRIAETSGLPKLCDNSTAVLSGTGTGTLVLGTGGSSRTTAGAHSTASSTSVSFDFYIPMDGSADSTRQIYTALGFVVEGGGAGEAGSLSDSTDTAITTWVSSTPWWEYSDPDRSDSFHDLLLPCGSPGAADDPCFDAASSGIFAADGSTRLVTDTGFSVKATHWIDADEGGVYGWVANVQVAPTKVIANSGYSIPSGSVAKISVSWPTTGDNYVSGAPFGTGDGQVDFGLAIAETKLKVNALAPDALNRWAIDDSSGVRIVTTLIGEARQTSSAISRSTWWPQCDLEYNEAGVLIADKCGADMDSSLTDDYMVFSSVPADVTLSVSSDNAPLAGGLVSTNGQGFAFGPQTMSGEAFQFAVTGPSFNFANESRATDGFYYVCIPEPWLISDETFGVSAAAAAASWVGTRDGVEVAGTSFAASTCGTGSNGLVASLDPFGYSTPVFAVRPPTPASGGSGGGAAAASPAPAVVASPTTPATPLKTSSARFTPEVLASQGSKPVALVGGRAVEVASSVSGAGVASVAVGAVALELSLPGDSGEVGSAGGSPSLKIPRGESLSIGGNGLLPASSLQVFVPFGGNRFSELPSITVADDGTFEATVSLATARSQKPLPIGTFSLQLLGVDEDGNETIIDLPLTVDQPAPFPEINRISGDQPALEPGEVVALNGGAPENVTLESSAGSATISGNGWSLGVQGAQDQGESTGLTFSAGSSATIAGEGLMPGTRADVWFFSTPTLLGSAVVGEDGAFVADFSIDPSLIAEGSHTLQIQGVGEDGYVRAANLGVTVSEPTTQASNSSEASNSGGAPWLWWLIGAMLAAGGLVLAWVWLSRRTTVLSRSGR